MMLRKPILFLLIFALLFAACGTDIYFFDFAVTGGAELHDLGLRFAKALRRHKYISFKRLAVRKTQRPCLKTPRSVFDLRFVKAQLYIGAGGVELHYINTIFIGSEFDFDRHPWTFFPLVAYVAVIVDCSFPNCFARGRYDRA